MKFGCCGSMIDPARDPIGIESAETIRGAGYDYIELSLRDIMLLSNAGFEKLRGHLGLVGLNCESCNNFLPMDIHVTGSLARQDAAIAYSEKALSRAKNLGVEVVVFGSPMSRDVDVDFDRREAEDQMSVFLTRLDPIASAYGITIAVEHVNEFDGILFADASETLSLVRRVSCPSIKLLVDYFHMRLQRESDEVVVDAADDVRHIHFSRIYKRHFPCDMREDSGYSSFFRALQSIDYSRRISIEAYPVDFASDAAKSLLFLRENLERTI